MTGQKEGAGAFFRRNGAALVIAVGLFALTYAVVFGFRTGDSDYIDHLVWAMGMSGQDMLESIYNGSERLWHICVKLLCNTGMPNMWMAAAFVSAASNMIAYFLTFKAWDLAMDENRSRWLPALVIAAAFVAASLTLPGFSSYTGRAAVNTWHNPTNIMVRPFAAAVFYMTVRIYDRRRYGSISLAENTLAVGFSFDGGFRANWKRPVYTRAELVLYPLCLLLSAYAKPSFLQVFSPAILIFLGIDVIRTKGRLLPFCLKMALAYLPAALILLKQVIYYFGGSTSTTEADASAGVAIYFIQQSFSGPGEFLGLIFRNIMQVIYPCAFPLLICILCLKQGPTSLRLGFTGMIVGWGESLLLHETGSRAEHGNFTWGYYLGIWLFWTAAVGCYCQLVREKTPRGRIALYAGTPLLLWHLACGIYYVVQILATGQYHF